MSNNFTVKYLNIYLFQGISIILGFVSLFIVLPFLTSNKELFGIYSICTSLTIYFSYADLGFGGAGQKFAVECYVQNDHEGEVRIVGFTSFVYILFMSFIAFLIIVIAVNPNYFLKGISAHNVQIARSLLLILACSAPVIALNRILGMIYSIRLDDYKYQRILIVGNVAKILIVFLFFSNGRYWIVPYYFTYHFITFLCCCVALYYVCNSYGYNLRMLLKSIRYDHNIFTQVKGLAFASLLGMLCWILYYELDQLAIGNLWGVSDVAVYAAAISIITYFRTYLGVIFSPLTTRFNYFVGLNDIGGLNKHMLNMIDFFFPFVVFPILVVFFFTRPFIYSWLGPQYESSVIHARFLVLCNLMAFITYPAGSYLGARQRVKDISRAAVFIASVFWVGVLLTKDTLGVLSFSSMKLVAFVGSAFFYILILLRAMPLSLSSFMKPLLKHYWISLLFCIGTSIAIIVFIPDLKDKGLTVNMLIMGCVVLLSFVAALPSSPILREKMYDIIYLLQKI